MSRLHIPFECQRPDVDEESIKNNGLSPQNLAEQLAGLKANAVFQTLDSKIVSVVIGSDQVITCENKIYSKPVTRQRAIEQLLELRGKTHLLITAVALQTKTTQKVFSVAAKLSMRQDLSQSEIERYVDLDSPLDCAGSYKIESMGPTLFDSIDCHDFTTIMGLPLIRLSQELRQLGFNCP